MRRALPENFEAQFANVVTNISRVLDEAGASFRDLVKVNVLLTRAADVADMNALYAFAFGPAPYLSLRGAKRQSNPGANAAIIEALPLDCFPRIKSGVQ
jgi:enamine deaminase RidA (YjgF/YER057c/UK114 family)